MERALKLCEALARMGAFSLGDYVLKSGLRTMYYVNTAVLANDVASFSLAVETLRELIEKVTKGDFERVVAPVGRGGAFAPIIANELRKPFALVTEGGDIIMGSLNAEESVILLDDVISTGATLASCVRVVRGEGARVIAAFTLIDRGEGGERKLAELGVELHSVLRIEEIADVLYSMGFISEEERDVLTGGE